MTDLNLTELEWLAVRTGINVADGHARQEPTGAQQKIISRLPDLFAQAATESEAVIDRDAQRAFLSALGQQCALTDAEVLTCYSSSVALEILGRSLLAVGARRIAMIHPTFDNIPDLLRGVGAALVPVPEEQLIDGSARLPAGTDVMFCTTPNNPTGRVVPREVLAHWARVCERRGIVLGLDTSFRGFDVSAQYDHYEVLAEAGCRYVVIEDTGKLWPTLDLKVGLLVFSRHLSLPMRSIYTHILLGVSPFILLLVRHFADDAAAGGLAELHRFVAHNRALLRNHLGAAALPDLASRISVARVAVPAGRSATTMSRELRRTGVHVLPCRQFHWAAPEDGERYMRVALGRQPEVVDEAAAAIRDCLARADGSVRR
jgi:enduracididine biosynthesis enzyme MppP